jgi:hypothetical protein
MVNLEIPSSYTFSPSESAPHLTINHDVAVDLDSTNAFEGMLYFYNPSRGVLGGGTSLTKLTCCGRPREAT